MMKIKSIITFLFLLISCSVFAQNLGGAMTNSACYQGEFIPNVPCVQLRIGNTFYEFQVKTYVKAMYLDKFGENIVIDINLTLEDPTNYFNPEAELPLLIRGIARSADQGRTNYTARSLTVFLKRMPGERNLSGNFQFKLRNNFGAEYTEFLDKLEILMPGRQGMLVVNF